MTFMQISKGIIMKIWEYYNILDIIYKKTWIIIKTWNITHGDMIPN